MLDLTIGRWELAARYDARQSFYRKAFYRVESVLVWLCADEDDYSATTVRHVREFLKQLDLEAGSKAEILKTYGLRDGKDGE